MTMHIGIGPTVEIGINPTIEVEETFAITITKGIDPIIETEVDQETMGMEMTMHIGICPTVDIGINPTIEVEETFAITITKGIDPIIETEVDQETMGIEEAIIPKTIEEMIIDRTKETKVIGIGIEVKVRTVVGLGKCIEAIPETTSEIGHMTEVKVEIEREVKVGIETGPVVERKDKGQKQNLEIEIETGKEMVGPPQDLDLVPMLIPTGIDLDVIDVVRMIILQEIAPTC